MIDSLREWWGPLVGGAGMLASYVAGREKTRHRIAEVSEKLCEVEGEVKELKVTIALQSVQLATIITDLKWIKSRTEGGR